jgi:F0F1-type ATP synthase membrane subunit b/b'
VALNHPEIAAILTENNVPAEKLAKHAARVQDLKEAKRHKEQALAAKHEAVAERNEAFDELQGWLRKAQRTARTVKKEHAARKKSPMSIEL